MLNVFLMVLGLQGGAALASCDSYLLQGQIQSGKIDMIISEVNPSAQACDLVLQKLDFSPDSQTLNLNLMEIKNCPLDVYGQRKVRVVWSLPSYAQPKSPLKLQVNGKILGEINFTTNEISQIREGGNP